MCAKMQLRSRSVEDEPRFVVGMDAHARKLAVSIWDWSDRFNACLHREIKCVVVDAMVKTYERHVDLDSITVIEASTNAAILKRRLNEAGFRAEVVRSDIIADKERKRKVCDIQDARNLALAYIKGDVRDFVWTPSDEYSEHRDVMFAYRDTVKELTRTSNRIWSVCSRKGYALPGRSSCAKVESLRRTIEESGIGGFAKERLEMPLEDYERLLRRKEALSRRMAETALSKPEMLRLMQLQGVNYKGAFALSAAVEDVRRFSEASKLAAYCGFSPSVDTSGSEEEKANVARSSPSSLSTSSTTYATDPVVDTCSSTSITTSSIGRNSFETESLDVRILSMLTPIPARQRTAQNNSAETMPSKMRTIPSLVISKCPKVVCQAQS